MKPEQKIFGLENFGNTCYCNSVLQALYHTPQFREYIFSISPTQRPKRLHCPGSSPHPAAKQAGSKQSQADIEHQARINSADAKFQPTKSKPQVGQLITGQTPLVGFLNDNIDGKAGEQVDLNDSDKVIELRKRKALLRGPLINANEGFHKQYNREESLVTAVKDLFESIGENESMTGVASPSRLVEVLKQSNDMFRSSMHQDAQEFLSFLLNKIVEEEAQNVSKLPGPSASELFGGELTNETRCLFCETNTQRHETVYDISLDTSPNTSVFSCLRKFSQFELLGGTNKFFCDVCGSHQEALKSMKVRKAPKVLILHLKRFKFSEEKQENTKLLHRVIYSRYLRIPTTTLDCKTPEKLYELTSVVVHMGGGPYMGHYVVVTRTANGWLLFDDEIVDQVDESFVFKFFGGDNPSMATVYLLFYQEISEERHEQLNSVSMESVVEGNVLERFAMLQV